jgi:DNA-binding GntR family transcriptional regulator
VHTPTAEEAEQLFAVRALLETESAKLAARNVSDSGLDRLRALVDEGMAAVDAGEGERAVEANAELHRVITEMSGNSVLAELAMRVARRVRWYHGSVVDRRGRSSWVEHARIIDAIAAGAEDDAGELMRQHTERTRRMYLEEVAQDSAATPSR